MKTHIVSGFPGVGKSYASTHSELTVIDADSSAFSWLEPGVRNPDFPSNYIAHIQSLIGTADVVFVSSHEVVRDALREANMTYLLFYPDKRLKAEYLERYRSRGNDEAFINMIDQNWDAFIDAIEAETHPTLIKLHAGSYVKDMMR